MISCVSWVPKGAADPKPKRFELSRVEQEMLASIEKQHVNESGSSSLECKRDNASEDETGESGSRSKVDSVSVTHKAESGGAQGLLAEYRMDEYSSDEASENAHGDGGGAVDRSTVGNLLITSNNVLSGEEDEEDETDSLRSEEKDQGSGSMDDDGHEPESNEADDREYLPIDVKGLQAMNLGQSDDLDDLNDVVDDDGDDSDLEDTNLTADDALILVAKTEEDYSSLEVHVYEQRTGNLFVHHDISLPAFPISLAHGDIGQDGNAGNFCAVGMFSPGIEVWNLDVLDPLEPVCILGGYDWHADKERIGKLGTSKKAKGRRKKKGVDARPLLEGSHTDAVMALSWNSVHRHVIASGSADETVKLWDITQDGKCPAGTFTHHKDKVQSVVWHPTEATILATGSFDRTVTLIDARSKDGGNCKKSKLPADCESIAWDPFREHILTASSEDGTVLSWDVRNLGDKSCLWSFVAHDFGGVSDISYSRHVPGLMASCAIDSTVAMWDVHRLENEQQPYACGKKDMGVGKLYSVSFYPSLPWLVASGGSGNQLALWDLTDEAIIEERFSGRSENLGEINGDESRKDINFNEVMDGGNGDGQAVDLAIESMAPKKKSNRKGKKKVHRRGRG